MSGRDFNFYRGRDKYPRQELYNENKSAPRFVEDGSFVGNLERKIEHQNLTINNLIKAFEESRLEQQRQIQYLERLKKTEEQKYSIQILEELKNLKHKIKKIEQSPPIQQSTTQMYCRMQNLFSFFQSTSFLTTISKLFFTMFFVVGTDFHQQIKILNNKFSIL